MSMRSALSVSLRRLAVALVVGSAVALAACGAAPPPVTDPLVDARHAGLESTDGETIGRWLLFEMVAPGGDTEKARDARARLDKVAKDQRGLYASLARGVDDESHGALASALLAYVSALEAARTSDAPEAPLLAWFASSHLLGLRASVATLPPSVTPSIRRMVDDPGRIGFRARGDLVDWVTYEMRRAGKETPKKIDAETSRLLGCIHDVNLAGPFGGAAPLDIVTSFDAERPGAWPLEFEKHPRRTEPPKKLAVDDTDSCAITAREPAGAGVHYAETFIDLDQETDLLLAVQGAWAVLVDDRLVLSRDPRVFGIWPRFGVALHLEAGRHRIVARLGSPDTSVRVLDLAGRPLAVTASSDESKPYSLHAPKILPDPNALGPFQRVAGVPYEPAWPERSAGLASLDTNDPVLRYVAASQIHLEAQDDLASVVMEPLVTEPTRAAPLALATQAELVEGDPIFAPGDARDLALDLRTRAVDKDARLWLPRLWLLLDAADKQGPKDQLAPLADLATEFREVPAVAKALGGIYAKLGYKPEHQRVVLESATRFPDDIDALRALVAVYDESGKPDKADEVAAHIVQLAPASRIDIDRALGRGDFLGAAKLLEDDAAQRDGAERAAFERRIADLMVRAGKRAETLDVLERALQEQPTNVFANMSLADARFAAGDHAALRKALAHAIDKGADTSDIRDAIEIVDGMSELEAYRLDPKKIIHQFEESGRKDAGLARGGRPGGGNAARVLDYAALWVHDDGSARMLEHEILFMQSREAITQLAEQRLPKGKILRIRTIKADGSTYEPELVSGKPTATMPHLEVGDYIETETLYDLPGDGIGGRTFLSPRWFFREEKIDYNVSEYVVISPKSKPLDLETTGAVPEPKVRELGTYIERRWRVEESPALPEEPASTPPTEFLPSVRAGWGVSQGDTLARLLDAATNLAPVDPRLVRIAKTIASAGAKPAEQDAVLAKLSAEEKSKRLYRWVLDNVQDGRESDPRKAVVGKSGSRMEAFLYLEKLVGVEARHAVVIDRLTQPPRGPISEAEQFTRLAAVITTPKGDLWTMVDDKYAPFGYLPSSMRGQPAVVLKPGLPRVTTGTMGPPDGVTHQGKVKLAADGSASIDLEQRYEGRLAIELREAIANMPEDRLKDAVESQLLPQAIPGARLGSLEVKGLEDVDGPLVLAMKLDVSAFAKQRGGDLVVSPPFAVRFGPLASLPKRETPILLAGAAAIRIRVLLDIDLPAGAHLDAAPEPRDGDNDGRKFAVHDHADGGKLVLDRVVDIPAGRVKVEDYPAFVEFARAIDEAFQRDLVLKVSR
ncbi:MAG TPA: hypothetical protein VL400_19245 [Polyangiaceae bacterium]|nr:hypothetical protein [Polyangiaceae bacterium]